MSSCHAQGIFSTTPDKCTWSSPGPLHPLYLFPSHLAPVGIWTDPPSLDQWILLCESQALGNPIYDPLEGDC